MKVKKFLLFCRKSEIDHAFSMKIHWTLYLAWKQLFPSKKKVSFFSMLAVIGVALGVNVMIVVIVFMQGFQEKFRKDIIDAQGHGRIIP